MSKGINNNETINPAFSTEDIISMIQSSAEEAAADTTADTAEEAVEQTEEKSNILKGGLATVLKLLSTTGLPQLASAVARIIEDATFTENGLERYREVSAAIQREISREEKKLKLLHRETPEQETLLSYLKGGDGESCLFERLLGGLYHLTVKLWRKLRKWLGERMVSKHLMVRISAKAVNALMGLLATGAVIAFDFATKSFAFAASVAATVVGSVTHTFLTIFEAIRGLIPEGGEWTDEEWDDWEEDIE